MAEEALGLGAACAAVFVAYVRAMGKAAGGGAVKQEFCGPMAKQQRMFIVTVTALYCGLAPAAWQPSWPAPSARSLRKTLLKLRLVPRWLTSSDFRLAFTSGVSANKVCFERELIDHHRMVFEKTS